LNPNTTEILIQCENNTCNGGGEGGQQFPQALPQTSLPSPSQEKAARLARTAKVSKNGSDESEHELAGFIGSALDGMSYGPFPIDDMSIGQITEESSFF
jgi:hypothetical protein